MRSPCSTPWSNLKKNSRPALCGGALLAPQFFLPAIGLNYLWEKVSKDKEGAKSPCFKYLNKQQ
jgi:hypothetical protein